MKWLRKPANLPVVCLIIMTCCSNVNVSLDQWAQLLCKAIPETQLWMVWNQTLESPFSPNIMVLVWHVSRIGLGYNLLPLCEMTEPRVNLLQIKLTRYSWGYFRYHSLLLGPSLHPSTFPPLKRTVNTCPIPMSPWTLRHLFGIGVQC